MDTCSRLEEPGGVEWKDFNVGRLRPTISGRRLIWWLRVAARSDRWPRNLACASPCCGAGWNCVGPGGSRRRRRGAQPVDATQALNLSAGFQIARPLVVVCLAGEPLCSDRLASAPT